MSIHSDWWRNWQPAICKVGALPMATDDLEERGGNVKPYRLFMAGEAETDDQTIVRMWEAMVLAQAEYETDNGISKRPEQYVLGHPRSSDQTVLDRLVGSFYTRASLPLGTMVRNIAVLDGMIPHNVTLRQYVWNSTTADVIGNYRFEGTRRLKLAPQVGCEDFGIDRFPGQSLTALHIYGSLGTQATVKARRDFLLSKTIRKGCVFTMVSQGREIYRRVK